MLMPRRYDHGKLYTAFDAPSGSNGTIGSTPASGGTMTRKRITKAEFVGLPIGQDDETAIVALVAQRQQVEQQIARINAAISAIADRLAKEAGWNVPAAELRIESDGAGGLVLKHQEAKVKPPVPQS